MELNIDKLMEKCIHIYRSTTPARYLPKEKRCMLDAGSLINISSIINVSTLFLAYFVAI